MTSPAVSPEKSEACPEQMPSTDSVEMSHCFAQSSLSQRTESPSQMMKPVGTG